MRSILFHNHTVQFIYTVWNSVNNTSVLNIYLSYYMNLLFVVCKKSIISSSKLDAKDGRDTGYQEER